MILRDAHLYLIPAFLLHSIKDISWQVQTSISNNIILSACFDLLPAARMPEKYSGGWVGGIKKEMMDLV